MAEVGTESGCNHLSCGSDAVSRLRPYALDGVCVERVERGRLQGDDGAADSGIPKLHTVGLVHLFVAAGYTAYKQQFGVVVETEVGDVMQELMGHARIVRVFGIAAVIQEGMPLLRRSDIMFAHRHEDGEFTIRVSQHRYTANETRSAIDTEQCTLYRVVRAFVINGARHLDRGHVGEVDVVMRVGVVVEIERSVRRRELVCAECRNDLVVRTLLAVRNTGDDVCTVGFGVGRVVSARGVVHHTQFDCRYRVNGGVVPETHAVNFEVSAMP